MRPAPLWLTLALAAPLAACSARASDPAGGSAGAAAAEPRPAAPASAPSAAAAAVAPRAKPWAKVRNVLLLTVDSLRADQPWSGYGFGSTPVLSALAEKSAYFTRMYSVANHTMPSLTAVLSGRYPSELPRDRCPLTFFQFGGGVASYLAQDGVYTFASQGHAVFLGAIKPDVGFDEWHVLPHVANLKATEGAVTGEPIAAAMNAFLRKQSPGGRRFFAWSHLVDPHDAYVRHADFPPSNHPLRNVYDGEVAYEDKVIGTILGALKERGLDGETAVVLTADHGEGFGEHGYNRHGYTVYEEEVHVPFFLYVPGLEPRKIDAPRSLIDLGPTLVELLGVAPPPSWRGTSLLADLGPEAPKARDVIVDAPELDTRPALRAVVRGDTKVMFIGQQAPKVFDLKADPEEKRALPAADAAPHVEAARAALDELEIIRSKPCTLTKEKKK
ncbi:MAG TPA: sulfatase [Polyangiaceae bacterium]|nr:sulfatase [Polyangiaceae bacterium]